MAAKARLTLSFCTRYPGDIMQVSLNPDLEARLSNLAAQQGRDTESLAREAIERLVDYDEWFLKEVEKGLAAADRGELIDHQEVGKLINSRYPG